tara:strand:+ start:23915 stop:24799 length:885 start_codon:yes stop_codon:yes gene_type:complete
MLPDNFNFAQMPTGSGPFSLKEVGMLSSTIEDIDQAMTAWVKDDLRLTTRTNEGLITVPVLWQAPERAYQIKHKKDLRDDAGALKLPLVSVERTNITKDPSRKGSFQAHLFSANRNGRSGRFVIAKRIVPNKTRNFAVAAGTRVEDVADGERQRYFPRVNKKVVIQTVSIPIPVYVSVDYKITLKSEYQQQMNDLVAPFVARTGQINAFTLYRKNHSYEAFIQQTFAHNNNVSNLAEDMRMFGTEITISVLGYLIGEGESDDRPIVRIDENTVEFQFPSESVVPPGNPNLFSSK